MKYPLFLVGIMLSLPMPHFAQETPHKEYTLYIGSYTDTGSKGVYTYRFDTQSEEATPLHHSAGALSNPSFLALSADETRLYAVSEEPANAAGAVAAFAVDTCTKSLLLINRTPTHGGAPCHLRLSPDGKRLLSANYLGGSISLFAILPDGSLQNAEQIITFCGKSIHPQQEASHAHCTLYTPQGDAVWVSDLGCDCLRRIPITPQPSQEVQCAYLAAEDQSVVPTRAGAGPRHLLFDKTGKNLYVLNELNGTLVRYRYCKGKLKEKRSYPSDGSSAETTKGCADLHFSPDGKFLYTSNRVTENTIAIFKVNPHTGALRKIGQQTTGAHPRNFAITPDGAFLLSANRDANEVEIFHRNRQTGLLSPTGKSIPIPHPTCVLIGR